MVALQSHHAQHIGHDPRYQIGTRKQLYNRYNSKSCLIVRLGQIDSSAVSLEFDILGARYNLLEARSIDVHAPSGRIYSFLLEIKRQ